MELCEAHWRGQNAAAQGRTVKGQDRGAVGQHQERTPTCPVILPSTNCRLYYRLLSNLDQCASVTNCSAADELANSWGLRRILSGTLGRYVALSGGLWNGGAHAPNYHSYESMLLKQLLAWPETVSGAPFFPPTAGLGDPTDSPRFTVLAALAHEFGHVLWYDVNDPTGTGSYDSKKFCPSNSASFFSRARRVPV